LPVGSKGKISHYNEQFLSSGEECTFAGVEEMSFPRNFLSEEKSEKRGKKLFSAYKECGKTEKNLTYRQ
jgi:hypothetical protein